MHGLVFEMSQKNVFPERDSQKQITFPKEEFKAPVS